jgi:hypothetical protein
MASVKGFRLVCLDIDIFLTIWVFESSFGVWSLEFGVWTWELARCSNRKPSKARHLKYFLNREAI